jgi:hypothetical protein
VIKNLFKIISISLLTIAIAGCQSVSTLPDGRNAACVGINGVKDPQYVYNYSVRNIVLGIIFIELIIPPVIILFDELQCPVGYVGVK